MHQSSPGQSPAVGMAVRRGCTTAFAFRHLAPSIFWLRPSCGGQLDASTAVAHAAAKAYASAHVQRFITTAAASTRDASSSSSRAHSRRTAVPDDAAAASVPASSGKTLMIVESPTKAAKIQKFLGSNFKVVASYGHVRDLASKSHSVKPEEDFSLTWSVSNRADARLRDIAAATAGCRSVILATDPDREGEAISWHITQELKRRGVLPRPGLSLQRVTFTEVTQKAVLEALQKPRDVSADLVDAYLARRALDYLVGYGISPVLWRKLGPAARSAGRVQSVALRLVCEREDAIQLFNPEEYWTITADLSLLPDHSSSSNSNSSSSSSAGVLTARLVQADGIKLQQMSITTQQQADALVSRLWQQQQQQDHQDHDQMHFQQQQQQQQVMYRVTSVIKKAIRRNPPPPFVTSTLQQEASRRLGFTASKTMQVAQQLYEGPNSGEGLITYMRTDGVNISSEATQSLRDVITSRYGSSYLPASGPRVYKSRAKNVQEAHEAIRPTDPQLLPERISGLTDDQAKLYSLIWRRAIASQMESAELQQVSVELESPCNTLLLRSTGSSMTFPGYQAAWSDQGSSSSSDSSGGMESPGSLANEDEGVASESGALSEVSGKMYQGQQLSLVQVYPGQHFTRPPSRYTEATMVKTLEEAGVGRPSTYAPIIKLLQDRGYVVRSSSRSLLPTPLGRLLLAYLSLQFSEYVDVNFTAKVEEQLDEVSAGAVPWKKLLREFHSPFDAAVKAAEKFTTTQVFNELEHHLENLIFSPSAAVAKTESTTAAPAAAASSSAAAAAAMRICPVCGGRLVLKPSRATGGFIGCSNHDSQGCTFGRPLWPDAEQQLLLSDEEDDVAAAAAANGGSSGGGVIGSSRLLGTDPATGNSVWIKRGPYGLYVQLGDGDHPAAAAGTSSSSTDVSADTAASSSSSKRQQRKSEAPSPPRASLPPGYTWSGTSLEQALELLALPRTVGVHPTTGEPVLANIGRFGPYIRYKSLFVNLPKDSPDIKEITLDHALQLLHNKEEKMKGRGRDPYAVKAKPGKQAAKKGSAATTSSNNSSKVKRLTGYNLFCTDMKDKLAAADSNGSSSSSSGGGGGGVSVLQQLAAMWKQLSEEEKTEFAERARRLNQAAAAAPAAGSNGHSDAAAVSCSSSSSSSSEARRNRGRPRSSESSSSSSSSSSNGTMSGSSFVGEDDSSSSSSSKRRRRSSSRTTTSSNGSSSSSSRSRSKTASSSSSSRRRSAPSLSGYQWFCKQQRGVITASNPAATSSEIMSLLAAAWRDLDEQQQQEWSQQAAAAAAHRETVSAA